MTPAVYTTLDEVLDTLYSSISGVAGSWDPDAEEAIFWPGARLCRSGVDDSGQPWLKCMTFTEYVADVGEFLASNDFFEIETRREVNRLGNIAQVRSYYEARLTRLAQEPERRGINFINLYHDGQRWWIIAMAWDNHRPGINKQNIAL